MVDVLAARTIENTRVKVFDDTNYEVLFSEIATLLFQ